MNGKKGKENLISLADRTMEERREIAKRAGKASGEARRRKRDMRELMKMMLEEKPKGKEYTYSERLTESMLTIASNPKQGAAAVRAYEMILHLIGQDEPGQVVNNTADENTRNAIKDLIGLCLENQNKNGNG